LNGFPQHKHETQEIPCQYCAEKKIIIQNLQIKLNSLEVLRTKIHKNKQTFCFEMFQTEFNDTLSQYQRDLQVVSETLNKKKEQKELFEKRLLDVIFLFFIKN
jgi:hypothetical protein